MPVGKQRATFGLSSNRPEGNVWSPLLRRLSWRGHLKSSLKTLQIFLSTMSTSLLSSVAGPWPTRGMLPPDLRSAGSLYALHKTGLSPASAPRFTEGRLEIPVAKMIAAEFAIGKLRLHCIWRRPSQGVASRFARLFSSPSKQCMAPLWHHETPGVKKDSGVVRQESELHTNVQNSHRVSTSLSA